MNKLENSFPVERSANDGKKLPGLICNITYEYEIAIPVQSICCIKVEGIRCLQVAENLVCCKDYYNPNFIGFFRVIGVTIWNIQIILKLVPQTLSSVTMFN